MNRDGVTGLKRITVSDGDVFLGLDWSADILSANDSQLLSWRMHGCTIHTIVYDFLPVNHPSWFSKPTVRKFGRWIKTVAVYSDSLICISKVVKNDAKFWFRDKFKLDSKNISFHGFPLGADLASSCHSRGIREIEQDWIDKLIRVSYFIQVGTLEPRKGHEDVLNAFEELWAQGQNLALVQVGRPGWKTESLQARIKNHSEYGKNLFWFDQGSDEVLEVLYRDACGVIVGSLGEGFGLPVIEAATYDKQVLARDIPVFREIGGSNVRYSSFQSKESLAEDIKVTQR